MIHGSGVVRAGQWARKLIINEDTSKGTMLPYINHITQQGWGVAVLNTNHNEDEQTQDIIPDNGSPEEHANTVWEEIIKPCQAKKIVIICHSYGGVVTMDLASRQRKDFMARVSGVFMTDSVHYRLTGAKDLDQKLELISKNYVTSEEVRPVLEVVFTECHSSGRWLRPDQLEERRGSILCRSHSTRVDILDCQAQHLPRSHRGLL